MKIKYITNILESQKSGGMSGINNAIFNHFKNYASYFSYQYINPPLVIQEKILSKLFKLLRIPKNYFFFSETRLDVIQKEFTEDQECDFYFFHGFTPWIKIFKIDC